jgi:hypothetical protein
MHDTARSRGRGYAQTRIALLVGLALTAIAVAVTLSGHPVTVSQTNGVRAEEAIGTLASNTDICQGGEVLPRDTTAIRVSLFAFVGPRSMLDVRSGSETLASGVASGWTAEVVTFPIGRVTQTASHATICVTLGQTIRSVTIGGRPTASAIAATSAGKPLRGRMQIEYLRPDAASWWSLILPVARRMGLGHAFAGTWIVLFLAALLAAAAILAAWILVASASGKQREPRRTLAGVPTAAWLCALVACLNAVCWSFIMPPFQAPDEPDHYAYVQQLAETGRLPSSAAEGPFSSQETRALQDLHYAEVREAPETRTISSQAEQRQLEQDLAQPLSQTDNHGAAGGAASEPPLYYALEAIPYRSSASPLERVELMRLLSALLAGATALFVFLFLREALPGAPRSWAVGALGIALAPLLGFISGAINPDAMLAAVSAALLYCLARGLRRGLTTRLAIAIGAVIAVGFLTKLNFVGLAPGAVLGLIVLAVREARTSRRNACRSLALALAIGGSPAYVYILVNVLSRDPALGAVSGAMHLTRGSPIHELSYVWQYYLPRLPGMKVYFPGILTTREIWFDRAVGLYGWLDTPFPGWLYDLALAPAGLLVALCVRALIANRAMLSRRAVELAIYATISVGVLALVGADSYIHSSQPGGELYAEPRYLLPLAALWGAVLALAARGAGRRWVPALGALIVTAIFAHDVFSQLQVIARYYG